MPSPTDMLPNHRGLELAASYRQQLALQEGFVGPNEPVSDIRLAELLGNQNVMVAKLALSTTVQAIYMRSDPVALVVVNRMDTKGRQRFSLVHELCHHVFHRELNTWICSGATTTQRGFEKEADEFASTFLLPAQGVWEQYSKAVRIGTEIRRIVLDLCLRYGTSWQNTVYRLSDLRLLSRNQREHLEQQKPRALAEFYGLPNELFRPSCSVSVPEEFQSVAKNLLDRDLISQRKYESVLESLDSLLACDRAARGSDR